MWTDLGGAEGTVVSEATELSEGDEAGLRGTSEGDEFLCGKI